MKTMIAMLHHQFVHPFMVILEHVFLAVTFGNAQKDTLAT
jgi:hypothetical protein